MPPEPLAVETCLDMLVRIQESAQGHVKDNYLPPLVLDLLSKFAQTRVRVLAIPGSPYNWLPPLVDTTRLELVPSDDDLVDHVLETIKNRDLDAGLAACPLYRKKGSLEPQEAVCGFPSLRLALHCVYESNSSANECRWLLQQITLFDEAPDFSIYFADYAYEIQTALETQSLGDQRARRVSDDYYDRYDDVVAELDAEDGGVPAFSTQQPPAVKRDSLRRHITQTMSSLAELSQAAGLDRRAFEAIVQTSMVHGNALVWS